MKTLFFFGGGAEQFGAGTHDPHPPPPPGSALVIYVSIYVSIYRSSRGTGGKGSRLLKEFGKEGVPHFITSC